MRRASTFRACAIIEGLRHQGGCRVCTVKAGGPQRGGLHPARRRRAWRSRTKRRTSNRVRRDLVEMLFHEGNHLCPICEESGNCELQAMAYRLGMTEPTQVPLSRTLPRPVDASHPDIALDTNRCISCGRCIRASQDVDGKGVFGYVGRGIHRRVAVERRRPGPYRCGAGGPRDLGRGLPGRLHHPQARGLHACRSASATSTTA